MAFRILIVDDSPVMRMFVRRVIAVSGFETSACLEAANGVEALELLQREAVDMILTDINMPEMGGDELMRRAIPMRRAAPHSRNRDFHGCSPVNAKSSCWRWAPAATLASRLYPRLCAPSWSAALGGAYV